MRLRSVIGNSLFVIGFLLLIVNFGLSYNNFLVWIIAGLLIIIGFLLGEGWRLLATIIDTLGGPARL